MPAPKRVQPHLSTLPWARIPMYLSMLKSPEFLQLESDEYTGEDGITLVEYEKQVADTNFRLKSEHAAKAANNKLKAVNFLKEFKADGIVPTLLAFFGTKQCAPIVVDGKVKILDSLLALKQGADNRLIKYDDGMVVTGDDIKGMLALLVHNIRGDVTTSKSKCDAIGHQVSMCRPLLMSAWKQYHGINYSSYDYTDPELRFINDPGTLGYLRAIAEVPPFTNDELRMYRNEVIAANSKGTARDVYNDINNTSDPMFNELPKQLKLLMLQMWVYQPQLYQSYAIMNLHNPDEPPIPLMDTDLFLPKTKVYAQRATKPVKPEPTPWD